MSTHTINTPFMSSIANSSRTVRHIGTSRALLVPATFVIAAIAAAAGLLVIDVPSSTVAQSRISAEAPSQNQQARKTIALPATMEVPAPATGSPAAFFIGTGDGSAGFWTQP